ncbi:hypothetical protein HK104_007418, partial [Borealophlyctis nickersoniae]
MNSDLSRDESSGDVLPGETSNELNAEERRILQRRIKKIADRLGESLDEKTVSQNVTHIGPEKNKSTYNFALDTATVNLPGKEGSLDSIGVTGNAAAQSVAESPLTLDFNRGESSISLASTNTTGSTQEPDPDSKLSHKRRLDKLSHMMGERIGRDQLTEAQGPQRDRAPAPRRPLTAEEKKVFQKKAGKLERMLGQLPPAEALITASQAPQTKPVSAAVQRVRRSIAAVSFVVKNTKDVVELLETLTEITDENIAQVHVPATALQAARQQTTTTTTASSLPSSPSSGSIASSSTDSFIAPLPTDTKESRQRRLNKLRKFFGDNVSVELLVEQQIIGDIERSMEEEDVDQNDLTVLRQDIETLRREIRTREQQLIREMSVEDEGPIGAVVGEEEDEDVGRGRN